MAKKRSAAKALKPRKVRLQKRSPETVAVILEAAARIREQHGFEGFNTNANAERAGVSVGLLYQYFRSKDALLSGLIERQVAPLLSVSDDLVQHPTFRAASRSYISASTRHQMKRPKLARRIDLAEKREADLHLKPHLVELRGCSLLENPIPSHFKILVQLGRSQISAGIAFPQIPRPEHSVRSRLFS